MIEQTLSGRYKLDVLVGEGGMARVFRGTDLRLGRTVAIKILHPQYAANETFLRRFDQEARLAAGLTHPHIVSVYDVGQDGEQHYIVLEYVDGDTLKDLVRRSGTLSINRAVEIETSLLAALDFAHRHQLVHRDIKSQNILIARDGAVKVADFGIAHELSTPSFTATGVVLGSVHYFAPEQARGQAATPQSDIYAAGIVLFEMLTGRLPFQAENSMAVAMQQIYDAPPLPSSLNPAVPPLIERTVLTALAKDPEARYASAADFSSALSAALRGESLPGPQPNPVTGNRAGSPSGFTATMAAPAADATALPGTTRGTGPLPGGTTRTTASPVRAGTGATGATAATGATRTMNVAAAGVTTGKIASPTSTAARNLLAGVLIGLALLTVILFVLFGGSLFANGSGNGNGNNGGISNTARPTSTATPQPTASNTALPAVIMHPATTTPRPSPTSTSAPQTPTATSPVATSTPRLTAAGATATLVPTATMPPSPTPTDTPTDTPSETPIPPTSTMTDTPTALPTDTQTDTPTDTSTDIPTNTPTNTPMDTPTNTPADTATTVPTETPSDTPTPRDTNTPRPTRTPSPTTTDTPVPATDTPVPLTNTPVPPTDTSVPETATATAPDTSVPISPTLGTSATSTTSGTTPTPVVPTGNASLSVAPASGPAGLLIAAIGAGWPAGATVTFSVDLGAGSQQIATTTVDQNGSFRQPFKFPASALPDTYQIVADDGQGDTQIATYQVNS